MMMMTIIMMVIMMTIIMMVMMTKLTISMMMTSDETDLKNYDTDDTCM